jgi:hypothetical protein
LQEGRHHFEVNHRGLIDDHHIGIEPIARMVSESATVGLAAQQRMQGLRAADLSGEQRQIHRVTEPSLQLGERTIDRLA